MKERRTHPSFLSESEANRERKRTESFVRSIVNSKQNKPSLFKGRLCDSCGVLLQIHIWFCQKCNICFCYNCGEDFSKMQKRKFPLCPICDAELKADKSLQIIHDKLRILRYVKSTNIKLQSEEELIRKKARLFKKDVYYVKRLWTMVKKEHPISISKIAYKFKDEQGDGTKKDRSRFRPVNNNLMEIKPKIRVYNFPKIAKPTKAKKENVDLKEVKRTDGFELKWKQGKMEPAHPKKYRGTFQDKD